MNAEQIAKTLGGHRSGGEWRCKCPAHCGRSDESLALNDGEKGLLAFCHAGCEFADIMAAIRRDHAGILADGEPEPEDREEPIRGTDDAAKLPEPVINTHHHDVEVDFRWGSLCVEVDGGHHARPRTKTEDRAKQAILEANGCTVIRFTEAQIDLHPGEVITSLRP